MSILVRATGLRQRTAQQRSALPCYAPRTARTATVRSTPSLPLVQPIHRIIDQGNLGACVGCTMDAGAEVLFARDLSWARIWTRARQLDGTLDDTDVGTWFTSAVDAARKWGFDVPEPGEESRLAELTQPDDLGSILDAYDRRQGGAEHARIACGDIGALADALATGALVGIATGVKTPYFAYFSNARDPRSIDEVLTTEHLGGSLNGHEQRIFGLELVGQKYQALIQNSWGPLGGCHLPDGTWQPGCCRVDESVLRAAWDIDAIHMVAPRGGPNE